MSKPRSSSTLPKSMASSSASASIPKKSSTLPHHGHGQKTRDKRSPTPEGSSSGISSREAERLNKLLSKLNIRFKNCTFTYKSEHLQNSINSTSSKVQKPLKSKSKLKRFTANVRATLDRFSEAVGVEESEFKSCIFVPKSQESDVKQFIRNSFGEVKLHFENCKFIKRPSSFFEKVARRLRGIFGIIFELTYPDGTAVVEEYSFRMKDISVITVYVQERIVEKG